MYAIRSYYAVRGVLMNILYFLAHSLEIPPAWLLRIRPRLFRNKLVIIDRYYFDFMVDPRRFRIRVSARWAWLMYRFMPKPGRITSYNVCYMKLLRGSDKLDI